MTDIIERLRKLCENTDVPTKHWDAMHAAADEIERLRELALRLDHEPPSDCPHGPQCVARGACWRKCSLSAEVLEPPATAPADEPKRKVIHVTESMESRTIKGTDEGKNSMGVGSAALWGEMTCERAVFDKPVTVQRGEALELDMQAGTVRVVPASDDEDGDLYLRLHSLSKSLEGSGRIDEHDDPGAYSTVLDAMIFVRRTEADMERWSGKLDEIQQGVLDMRRENERLRAALDRIAERTGSDDPCRHLVQIARDVLAPTAAPAGEPPEKT